MSHRDRSLPSGFRHLPIDERRSLVADLLAPGAFGVDPAALELADVMVESAVGYLAVPVGIASGFLIDGALHDLPLATEEPSVIAAAGYAASVIRAAGGFVTEPGDPITIAQIFVERAAEDARRTLLAAESSLREIARPLLRRMEHRGGGWVGIDVTTLARSATVLLQIHLDVRDAMGANIANSVAEALRTEVERLTGGRVVMAILSNASDRRVTRARFGIPVGRLGRAGVAGEESARRIALANEIADETESRAVTHNKGIMNGITALALATGNDTRAIEAAAHEYASRTGRYRPLTAYRVADGALTGEIALPLAFGTVGGAAGLNPTSRHALALLGNPSAIELARIAAALGLAQNFAALFALVTEGIQRGHMGLHANRIAYLAGARGSERERLVQAMRASGEYTSEFAREALERIRESDEAGA